MKQKHYFLSAFLATATLLTTGCSKDDTEDSVAIGKNSTVYVSSDAGQHTFNIETSAGWSAELADAATRRWISFENHNEGSGNGSIQVNYRANTTFSREGRIVVKLQNAPVADTIFLRQYGVTPVIEFQESKLSAASMGAAFNLKIHSNFASNMKEQIQLAVESVSGTAEPWIENLQLSEDVDQLSGNVLINRDVDRESVIRLSYTDDWGIPYVSTCTVDQLSLGGTNETKTISVSEARALAESEATTITGDFAVEGYVVSDCTSDNVAANPNTGITAIDYSKNYRTVYLESTDGQCGISLVFDDKSANTFSRYAKVAFWLKDAVITKATNPERYTVSNLSSKAVVNIEQGTAADLPIKEKSIADLSADDIYTYVTLKDCELPVKKGSYTPINEGYGSAYNAGRVDMYPLTVRDKAGNHIFMMTNISVPWRRNGSQLPQGAGSISGIIVHETYERFEKDGNIGDFQIRPLFSEDIKIAKDASAAYSKTLAEWKSRTIVNNIMPATTGTGELSQSSALYAATAYATNDFSLLGPIDGTTDNKGVVSGGGWANAYWWDATNLCGESWVLKFSTQGIKANHIYITIAAMHNALGAPRYWDIEWSTHGEKLGEWTKVGDYTVPDPVQWGNTLYTQVSGWKNICMELPNAILGQKTVYVRLKASQNKAGTTSSYDGTTIISGKASALAYLSIQYND